MIKANCHFRDRLRVTFFNKKFSIICETLIARIMEIILWDFLMFFQIFLSPQVKGSAIIGNKQGVYELANEFLNDLKIKKA